MQPSIRDLIEMVVEADSQKSKSLLVAEDGTPNNYAVCDDAGEKIIGTAPSLQGANRLRASSPDSSRLVVYNLTHGSIPGWLSSYMRRDTAYCAGRKNGFLARAKSARAEADRFAKEAETLEAAAAKWDI